LTQPSRTLTLAGAKAVLHAAEAQAARLNAGGAVAVVDAGGNLLAVHRTDGTFPAGAEVSIGKARTAALFRKPTRVFEEAINKGRVTMTTVGNDVQRWTPLQGGVPIVVDGEIVGAVGVSGAHSAEEDEVIALAAAQALSTAPRN
jgi:uncharacterized protein GlcG (DUF336 family)